jgi:anti-sigma factor RsiW
VTDWGKFEEKNRKRPECELCEAMCPDAVDGTLTETERRVFEQHVAGCVACARELEEAQRGAAWLGMLKGHTPEPPAELLARILAGTTGENAVPTSAASPVHEVTTPVVIPVRDQVPVWALSSLLRKTAGVFRMEGGHGALQPRLAMTAAMAFFSIALTLSMTGVRLGQLRLADLSPSALRRTAADARASAERNFQNMRVVYQVESRVSELRGEGPLAEREATYPQPQSSAGTSQKGDSSQPAEGNARYKPL